MISEDLVNIFIWRILYLLYLTDLEINLLKGFDNPFIYRTSKNRGFDDFYIKDPYQ